MPKHDIDYRDYQVKGRDAAFGEFANGVQSTLVVMPTGTGKTVLAGMCAERQLERPSPRTLFVAHREILIRQAFKTFQAFGFDTAIEMGTESAFEYKRTVGDPQVVVGSIQSLQDDRLMRWSPKEFGLIIADECHRSLSDSYTKTFNWFNDYTLLGITATPKRGDRRNLGTRFQTKAFEYRLRNAIEEKWLVPIKVRTCPTTIDLRGLKTGGADFSVGELEEKIMPLMEPLARQFVYQVGKRPAVVFLPDVASASAFAEILNTLNEYELTGVSARYVAGTGGTFGMDKAERNENLEAFNVGEYQVIVCCELLIEGWDCPRVECVGILRPTLQQYRYCQMVGRGTRLSPSTGKTDLLVLDFDWQTDDDVKDLCSVIELFDDGSLDSEVYAVAKRIAKERAVDIDPIDVIEEAERFVRTRQRFRLHLTGKEEKLAAIEHDPVGVAKLLDIKLNRRYDLDKNGDNPATIPQLRKLADLGVQAPEGLSKWGASKMIDKILKRQNAGLSTPAQVQALMVAGLDPALARGMSRDEARQTITEIDAAKKLIQGSFF